MIDAPRQAKYIMGAVSALQAELTLGAIWQKCRQVSS